MIENVKYVDKANFPILKINTTNKYLNKRIDITMNENDNKTHNGKKCVNLVKKYLKKYEVLKPLVLVLKQMVFFA